MRLALTVTAAAVLLAGIGTYTAAYTWWSEDTRTCTVTDKDRTTNSDGTSNYRVYTDECGTLTVEDALLRGNVDTADDYADIEPGTTYEITTIGWRVPILSAFPNIIDAEPV